MNSRLRLHLEAKPPKRKQMAKLILMLSMRCFFWFWLTSLEILPPLHLFFYSHLSRLTLLSTKKYQILEISSAAFLFSGALLRRQRSARCGCSLPPEMRTNPVSWRFRFGFPRLLYRSVRLRPPYHRYYPSRHHHLCFPFPYHVDRRHSPFRCSLHLRRRLPFSFLYLHCRRFLLRQVWAEFLYRFCFLLSHQARHLASQVVNPRWTRSLTRLCQAPTSLPLTRALMYLLHSSKTCYSRVLSLLRMIP
mmetsp:Transcript_8512/g.20556  ORF Transcript_8512/g.20556 Transcript_8512/m.20556 type:complete len:248 (+) Transcript_8512:1149-1892(+)